jgi:hypothetical protein
MLERVPDSEKQRRLDICTRCEFYVQAVVSCSRCWCFLPAKTSLVKSRCPMGRWAVTENHQASTPT